MSEAGRRETTLSWRWFSAYLEGRSTSSRHHPFIHDAHSGKHHSRLGVPRAARSSTAFHFAQLVSRRVTFEPSSSARRWDHRRSAGVRRSCPVLSIVQLGMGRLARREHGLVVSLTSASTRNGGARCFALSVFLGAAARSAPAMQPRSSRWSDALGGVGCQGQGSVIPV